MDLSLNIGINEESLMKGNWQIDQDKMKIQVNVIIRINLFF